MITGLEKRWGGGGENPTVDELRAALAELSTPDMEHPSTWLVDHDGWNVDVYESGLVIFFDKDTEICRRRGVSRDEALELWLLLQRGQRDEIKRKLLAQPGPAPNVGPATRLGNSGVSEGPPSVS